MNPIEAVSSVFRNYVNFNGRAQRSEFWWFVLFALISQIILNMIPFVGGIYSLVLLLPSLAVTARRLHDTDRTAWWMLLYLIPVLGLIVLTVVFIAMVGISALDSWETTEVEWGVLAILTVIWIIVSFVSWMALLVFQVLPGTVGPNRYGPDPLRPGVEAHTYAPGDEGPAPFHAPPPRAGGYSGVGAPPPHPDLPQAGQSPAASERQRRFCTQCGTRLEPEARLCTYCGTAS